MSSSLSSLVDNLALDILFENKSPQNIKIPQTSGKCECGNKLDYMRFKDNHVIFKCFRCNTWFKKEFNKDLINKFKNAYEFCHKDMSKFILLLRKDVYPYEYMDSWERFNQTSLPDKEAFYSSLNMEDITDVDHRHAKRVFKKLNNKILGDYHDLYAQSDTLLLADVFENFRNKCIEIYELDPAHFLSALRLAWQACLKKQK